MPIVTRLVLPLAAFFGGPVRSEPLRRPRLWRCYDRYLQRRRLADLDDHLLEDIGLTRADVERECRKSPWL